MFSFFFFSPAPPGSPLCFFCVGADLEMFDIDLSSKDAVNTERIKVHASYMQFRQIRMFL